MMSEEERGWICQNFGGFNKGISKEYNANDVKKKSMRMPSELAMTKNDACFIDCGLNQRSSQ